MDSTPGNHNFGGDVVMDSTSDHSRDVSTPQPTSLGPANKVVATPSADRTSRSPSLVSPYVPQFSAATSFILNRMKSTGSNFNSALSDLSAAVAESDKDAYEEFKTKLVQSMSKGTSLPEPPPLSTPGEPSLLKTTLLHTKFADSSSSSLKRKREPESSTDVDFGQSTMPFPSGSQSPGPSMGATNGAKQECSVCRTSVSFEENQVIICQVCGIGRHQQCWSPPVLRAGLKRTTFTCERCEITNATQSGAPTEYRDQRTEKIRRKRLAMLPAGVVPVKPELVGFGAGTANDHARTAYFQNMRKTDLLNILSFCDQLQPQLIVDIMVSVSKKHPNLPIFASPDWQAPFSEPAGPAKATKRGSTRPSHGRSLLNSKAKQKIKSTTSNAKNGTKRQAKKAAPAQEDVPLQLTNSEEDTLPPAWPRAGQGMYAKLVPEVEDRSLLKDDNDEGAFSHFMVSNMGKQIIEPV
ncbi:unnamed protein product [Clonostachys rosea]|uniref:PHD-type domain-containing protein n=1 Tax=Bionectria ochroleuca TaxID=29856 RepID=A0ABY6U7J9_BIOOC|nr:unnamed protein product [Clonostachys rosea]